jgi:hypothetical protein
MTWSVFLQPENLRKLCWLYRKEPDQIQTALAALQLSVKTKVRETKARSEWSQWPIELITARRALQLRAPLTDIETNVVFRHKWPTCSWAVSCVQRAMQ